MTQDSEALQKGILQNSVGFLSTSVANYNDNSLTYML